MMRKTIILCCLFAVLVPFAKAASTTSTCQTAEECKTLMEQEFKSKFLTFYAKHLENQLEVVEKWVNDLQAKYEVTESQKKQLTDVVDEAKQQLTTIKSQSANPNAQELVNGRSKIENIFKNFVMVASNFMKTLEEIGKPYTDVEQTLFDNTFEIWDDAAKLKPESIEIEGFADIDKYVQTNRDVNFEYYLGLLVRAYNRIVKFYNLDALKKEM